MKVLYVSYDGMTDPLGQSQVIPYLRGLTAKGHQITLLSCEKPHLFAKNKELIEIQLRTSGIRWEPLFYHKDPPVLSTIIDIVSLKRRAARLFNETRFDIVHCRSYIAAFVGLWAKRKYRAKFLFDIRGFWADEKVDCGSWDLSHPLYRSVYYYFKRREREFFSQADGVISLTERAKEIIQNWPELPGQPIPVDVIPCCVDLDLFAPETISEEQLEALRIQLGLNGEDLVVSYLGSINTIYMFDEMMRFFALLLLKKPKAKFLFITQSPREEIIKQATMHGVGEDHLVITEAGRKAVPSLLKLSQVSIFFRKPAFSNAACSPTKQGEVMGLGIPIICNSGIGDTDFVISKYRSGLVVDDFSECAYDLVIEQLDELLSRSPATIRSGAHEFYSLDLGVARYDAVYNRLAPVPVLPVKQEEDAILAAAHRN